MKKKLAVLLATLLIVCILCSSAMAATAFQSRVLQKKVDTANARIELYVKIAQFTPYDDVAWLLAMVDITVKPVIRYAKSIGETVVCDLEEYWIDGRIVLVDPLRVVNVGTGGTK